MRTITAKVDPSLKYEMVLLHFLFVRYFICFGHISLVNLPFISSFFASDRLLNPHKVTDYLPLDSMPEINCQERNYVSLEEQLLNSYSEALKNELSG
jgi:hypothetical protein